MQEHATDNVAKSLVEFSTKIPREELRPGFGHGFLGAPLTENSQDRPTQQVRRERRVKLRITIGRGRGGHRGI